MEDFLWELKTERFLNGEMTSEELLAFEQEQIDKPELKEYVLLSREFQQALSEDDWLSHKKNSEHYKTVKKWYQEDDDVLDFKKKLQQHADTAFNSKKNTVTIKRYWIPIAAACIALFFIIYQFAAQPSMEQLYLQYATWNDTPSFIVQDQNALNVKEHIELLYKNEKYEECIIATNTYLSTYTTDTTNVLIYKGFSLVQLNKYSEALSVFKTISNSNTIDASKGLWYMALVYLKMEDTENLQKVLKTITSSKTNYQYTKAVQLLSAI